MYIATTLPNDTRVRRIARGVTLLILLSSAYFQPALEASWMIATNDPFSPDDWRLSRLDAQAEAVGRDGL